MAQVPIINVIAPVAQKCRSCPTPVLVQAYLDAAREWCGRSRWLRATIAGNTIAVPPTRLYSLGSDTYNEIIGITAIDITESVDDIHPLTEKLSSEWDTTEANDTPQFYSYVPEGQFALHPLPDQVYALSVGVVIQPKRGQNSLDDTLLVNWEYAFRDGALAYLLDLQGEKWANPQLALQHKAKFEAACFSGSHVAEGGYNPGALASNALGPRAARTRTKMQAI